MEKEPNILLTCGANENYETIPGAGLRFLVLSNMGDHSNDPLPDVETTAADLHRLTLRELDVCVLCLADGRSQETAAEWLGMSRRSVQMLLASAVAKVPPLASIRANHRPTRRPKVFHLSQIGRAEQGPFDADDL